jgi:hypothetical protein
VTQYRYCAHIDKTDVDIRVYVEVTNCKHYGIVSAGLEHGRSVTGRVETDVVRLVTPFPQLPPWSYSLLTPSSYKMVPFHAWSQHIGLTQKVCCKINDVVDVYCRAWPDDSWVTTAGLGL